MTITYINQATRPLNETDAGVRQTVSELLAGLETGREAEAARLAAQFDGWEGPIEVSSEQINAASSQLDQSVREDIEYAHRHFLRISRLEGMEGHARSADLRVGTV